MTIRRPTRWPRITRDTALLVTGLALTVNEAVFRHGPERPYLLMLYAGMMGLPVFLRSDERKSKLPPDQPSKNQDEGKENGPGQGGP